MESGLFLPQIFVAPINPIGAGWREDVEINRVHERFGFVRHVGGNAEDFAGVNCDFFAVDPELQCAIKDVGELLVVMAVLGHDASFFQEHARQHNLLPDDELPLKKGI
jgi:hypothetical protein